MLLKGNVLRNPIIKIGGKNMECVTQHTYLGILLYKKLSFKQHLTEAANKATSIFYKIRRGAKATWSFDSKALTILYQE